MGNIWLAEIVLALLVAAYVISGIDDLAIDIFYWVGYATTRSILVREESSYRVAPC